MCSDYMASANNQGDQDVLKMYQISFTGPQAIESIIGKQSDSTNGFNSQQIING